MLLLGGQLASQLGAVASHTSALSRISTVSAAMEEIEAELRSSRTRGSLRGSIRSISRSHAEAGGLPRDERRSALQLEGVTYRYPGAERDALEDVSLVLPGGPLVALVGPNGAGKSTLVKLIVGMIGDSANAGLSDNSPSPVMFQQPARFEMTLKDSIASGRQAGEGNRTDALDAACNAAIEATGVSDVLLEDGVALNSRIGSLFGARNLSGGQWQVVAASRSLFCSEDADLVVWDEPTSAMDAHRARRFFGSMVETAKTAPSTRITLFTTHRPRLALRADVAVVIQQGRVVQVGSPLELRSRPGWFSDWCAEIREDGRG